MKEHKTCTGCLNLEADNYTCIYHCKKTKSPCHWTEIPHGTGPWADMVPDNGVCPGKETNIE